MNDTDKLKNLVLAPYIIKATALIGRQRNVGGNQFRHAMATLAILLDYKLFDDYVLLKAAVIHDLIEDVPETDENELRQIDEQANEVVDLVLEVSRPKGMNKAIFLKTLLEEGSSQSKDFKSGRQDQQSHRSSPRSLFQSQDEQLSESDRKIYPAYGC